MTESVDSLSRSDAEIVNKWIPSVGRMIELYQGPPTDVEPFLQTVQESFIFDWD